MAGEPSAGQRKLVFAGLVVLLVGVGLYFTLPVFGGGPDAGADQPAPSAESSTPAATRPTRSGQPTGSVGPTPTFSPTAAPPEPGQLLPVSEQDLVTAATIARRFVIAYNTYRYDEPQGAYYERMQPLVTDPIASELEKSSSGAMARSRMRKQRTIATASAEILRTRVIARDSAVFVIRVRQEITEAAGTENSSRELAITVVRTGGTWKVANMARADAGNAGASEAAR